MNIVGLALEGYSSNLCGNSNATETIFPGTELRLIYELVSPQYH
jgi:hypothetical protein